MYNMLLNWFLSEKAITNVHFSDIDCERYFLYPVPWLFYFSSTFDIPIKS
jgi:hypothetical protein